MKQNRQRDAKPRLLILIVADNDADTVENVVRRIPSELSASYDVQVLIIDDASRDSTFAESDRLSKAEDLYFPVCALLNPVKQGYGGTQKLGYHFAIVNGFDFVAVLRGNGQYAPECLPGLIEPLRRGLVDAVFGFRTPTAPRAFAGGMPFLRFVGNRILTRIENCLLHSSLRDFHSGFRIYSVAALRAIPFERNSNGRDFDAQITIQLLIACRPIEELPIATYYGDKIRYPNWIRYAASVTVAAMKARLQELSLFYDRRFDCAPPEADSPYTPKLNYASTHTYALARAPAGARVLDLGCAGGYLGARLRERKGCLVTGMDRTPVKRGVLDRFEICDLNAGVPPLDANRYDVVLMLDVIEHLNHPERFLEDLRRKLALNPSLEFMISTANVACFATRAMLFLGQFNYGPRGILDVTHTRLFTFASFRRALLQAGFDILETKGVPAPYPLAIGENAISRALCAVNRLLIGLSRGLFSYQIFMRVKAQPTLELLLTAARQQSNMRTSSIETEASAGAAMHGLVQ